MKCGVFESFSEGRRENVREERSKERHRNCSFLSCMFFQCSRACTVSETSYTTSFSSTFFLLHPRQFCPVLLEQSPPPSRFRYIASDYADLVGRSQLRNPPLTANRRIAIFESIYFFAYPLYKKRIEAPRKSNSGLWLLYFALRRFFQKQERSKTRLRDLPLIID